MILRDYDPERDREAAHRIWREVDWLDKQRLEDVDAYIRCGRAHVAEIYGEAECLVLTAPGVVRYLKEDLPASFVTGVTTSRVARKQGLASRLTARAVAADAAEGALVSALGMFEQGYYDQIGFGTGSYEHLIDFDPAHLLVSVKARPPRRITAKDREAVHRARLARRRLHGGCNLFPPEITYLGMDEADKGFGLGYRDEATGEITHHLWCSAHGGENGPYNVLWMAYQTKEQFLELMAVVKSLGDQVHLVKMGEPPGIQMQDLIRQPFKYRRITQNSRFEAGAKAMAYWQMRICDLPGCLAQTHLDGEALRFNLRLTDPIERLLEEGSSWRGVGGDYIVTLGPESHAERGESASLPTLTASVNAFTRMWLGVRPASGLAYTDDLVGPPELLERLDRAFRLPVPKPDWDF